MSDKSGAHQYGPVLSPMESLPGNPKDFGATGGSVTNGVPGYPKGSDVKADEVTFDNSGGFGDVKKAGS